MNQIFRDFLFDLDGFFNKLSWIFMSIKVFNRYFLNFDILGLNPSNFTFKMTNFLIGAYVIFDLSDH